MRRIGSIARKDAIATARCLRSKKRRGARGADGGVLRRQNGPGSIEKLERQIGDTAKGTGADGN